MYMLSLKINKDYAVLNTDKEEVVVFQYPDNYRGGMVEISEYLYDMLENPEEYEVVKMTMEHFLSKMTFISPKITTYEYDNDQFSISEYVKYLNKKVIKDTMDAVISFSGNPNAITNEEGWITVKIEVPSLQYSLYAILTELYYRMVGNLI